MKKQVCFLLIIFLFTVLSVNAAPKTLDIYFIDTEGGAATLIITPQGESLLVDSGNPGERDPGRIAHVARDVAKLQQIDHYITTHWHSDHVGGIAPLAKLIPVKHFYDHGFLDPLPEDVSADLMAAYKQTANGTQTVLHSGDELKFAKKNPAPLRLRILAAGGTVLGEQSPIPQVRPCGKDFVAMPEDASDNARSVVFLLTYGKFKFFDGGDLTWNVEDRLVCPKNLVGQIDVYQANHHGLDISNNPRLVAALHPQVAVVNNGPRKGGMARTFATLKQSMPVENIFQLHRNVATTAQDNAPPVNVANDAENCQGEYVKLSVDEKGQSYTVMVPSKGTTRRFQTR